jgi:hypothetical protein
VAGEDESQQDGKEGEAEEAAAGQGLLREGAREGERVSLILAVIVSYFRLFSFHQ